MSSSQGSSSQGSSSSRRAPPAPSRRAPPPPDFVAINKKIKKHAENLKLYEKINVFSEIKNTGNICMQQATYNNKRLSRRLDKNLNNIVKHMTRLNKQAKERFIKAEDRIKKLENKLGAAQGLAQMSTVGNKRRRTGGRKSRRKTRRKSRKRRRKKRRRKTKRKR